MRLTRLRCVCVPSFHQSGVPNFLCVSLALHELGYKPVGVRLDSGDLAYLSKQARVAFKAAADRFNIDYFASLSITASNDINEAVLNSLNEQVRPVDLYLWVSMFRTHNAAVHTDRATRSTRTVSGRTW